MTSGPLARFWDDLIHTYPRDVDILLSKNDGRQALALSDVIGGTDALDEEQVPAPPAPTKDKKKKKARVDANSDRNLRGAGGEGSLQSHSRTRALRP